MDDPDRWIFGWRADMSLGTFVFEDCFRLGVIYRADFLRTAKLQRSRFGILLFIVPFLR